MKILSKYKDFYDYLTGVYGVDPKIVLDRREFERYDPILPDKVVFIICGKKVEGYFDGNRYYYGMDLLKVGTRHSHLWKWRNPRKEISYSNYVSIKIDTPNRRKELQIKLEILDDELKLNVKHDCPILMSDGINGYCKFPPLFKYDIGQVFTPETIYKMLVDWYSNILNESENRVDTRNDVEKLESKGFDKKISFRKI